MDQQVVVVAVARVRAEPVLVGVALVVVDAVRDAVAVAVGKRLVDRPVAIVVQPVADLRGGRGRVAAAQSLDATGPRTGTRSVLVRRRARRLESQGHRDLVAAALTFDRHARRREPPARVFDLVARVSVRAAPLAVARRGAEPARIPEIPAERQPAAFDAVVRLDARPTQRHVQGHAQKEHVAVLRLELLAGPSRRAAVDARRRAHVAVLAVHAIAARAVRVFATRLAHVFGIPVVDGGPRVRLRDRRRVDAPAALIEAADGLTRRSGGRADRRRLPTPNPHGSHDRQTEPHTRHRPPLESKTRSSA